MSSKACPSFVACVVGLSLEHGEAFGRRTGIGKSCFCHRFMYPGFDDYMSNHQSLYALHEFESRVINNDHFLYWGSAVKSFCSSDPSRTVDLRVHVLEHSVFYQDITCQPFTVITKPDKLDFYVKRITSAIESPGKLSYRSRDEVSTPEEYSAQEYPPGISKVPRGFLVVVDISQKGDLFEKQLKRAEKVLEYLTKHKRKTVIVATKRDAVFTPSLERVYELKKKFQTHVVEVSAEQNLNISECFRVLAYKLFKGSVKLSSHVQTYPEAAHISLSQKGSAKNSFSSFLKKRILDPNERLTSIDQNQEYKECMMVIGKFETDKLFAMHVLEVYNTKVDLYAGAKENPEMREEFLEEFVAERGDLAMHAKDLKQWIESHISELSKTELDNSTELDDQQYDIPQLPPDVPADDYQRFERASPSQSHVTQDSGFHNGSNIAEADETARDNDSYYSDSAGSEGPDYINYDPKHPSPFLPEQSGGEPSVPEPPLQATPTRPHSTPLQEQPSPSSTTTSSPSLSIRSRAQALGSLLGHRSVDDESPPLVEDPPRQSLPRQLSVGDKPNAGITSNWASPPTPEPVHKPITPQRSIKERAQVLSTQLGHSARPLPPAPTQPDRAMPPPPAPKPKPSRSPSLSRHQPPLSEYDDTSSMSQWKADSKKQSDSGLSQGKKIPPPVSTRVSSLPNTPVTARKPIRSAPPPRPQRKTSGKDSSPIDHLPAVSPPLPPERGVAQSSFSSIPLESPLPPTPPERGVAQNNSPPLPLKSSLPPTPPERGVAQNNSPPLPQRLPPPPTPREQGVAQNNSPPLPLKSPPEQGIQSYSPPLPTKSTSRPTPEPESIRGSSTNQLPVVKGPPPPVSQRPAMKAPPSPTPERGGTQNFPPLPMKSPPPDDNDLANKPRLQAIRKKLQERKYELHQLKDTTKQPEPEHSPPRSTEPPPLPKPRFASVDIDKLRESATPPPLPRPLSPEGPLDVPQLPPRTDAMFIIQEDLPKVEYKPKTKNYNKVVMNNQGKSTIEGSKTNGSNRDLSVVSPTRRWKKQRANSTPPVSEASVTSPTRQSISPARQLPQPPTSRGLPPIPTDSALPRSQFLVMKNRPLPASPFTSAEDGDHIDSDDGHEYETFDFDHRPRPPIPQPSFGAASQLPPRGGSKEQLPIDNRFSGGTKALAQPLIPPLSRATVQRARTFNGNDRGHPSTGAPRPVPGGMWQEYVDGYVNADPPPPGSLVSGSASKSIQDRQLPLTPFQIAAQNRPSAEDNPDYDYPDLRVGPIFRTLPTKGKKRRQQVPVPLRLPRPHSELDPEYIDMRHQEQQGGDDDSYVNTQCIEELRGAKVAQGDDGSRKAYSQDDMDMVYMNLPPPPPLPSAGAMLPPSAVTMSLPPRTTVRPTPSNEQPQAKTISTQRDQTTASAGAATPTSFTSELQSRFHRNSELFSQSVDKASEGNGDDDDDTQGDYVNVSASLPASFLQGGAVAIPELLNVRGSGDSSPGPIRLPPRNIKRTKQE